MGRGTATLIGGLTGAAAFPLTVFALNFPLWLGAVVSGGLFLGAWMLLSPSSSGLESGALLEAREETARGLVSDGAAALARLKQTAAAIRDQAMRAQVESLAKTGAQVLTEISNNPDRAMAVRRLLTFYLPNAASLAEGWQTLEKHASPSPERVEQTRETMKALNDAFAKFAEQADQPELDALDLNLKVTNDALKSDLEKV